MTFTAVKTRARIIPPVPPNFGNILFVSLNIGYGIQLESFLNVYGAEVTYKSRTDLTNLKQSNPNYTLNEFSQVYDLDYFGDEGYTSEISQLYLDFLNGGGKLYLQGENLYYDSRNSVIRYLVNNIFGGNIDMGSNPSASEIARRGTNYFTGRASTRGTINFPSTLPQLLEGTYIYNGQTHTTGPGFGQYRFIDWTATFEGDYISLETATPGFDDVEYALVSDWLEDYNEAIAGVVSPGYKYDTTIMLTSDHMSNVTNPRARVVVVLDVNYWDSWFYRADAFANPYKSEEFWNDSLGQGQNLFASIYQQFLIADE